MIRRKVFFSLIRKLEKQLKLGLVLLTYSRIASKQQATVFHLFGFVEFILSLSLSLSLSEMSNVARIQILYWRLLDKVSESNLNIFSNTSSVTWEQNSFFSSRRRLGISANK